MRIEQKQKWVLRVVSDSFDAPETALEASDAVARLAVQVLPYDGQEHLFALAMDVHGVPLACSKVATGSVDNCPLFARDLFAWGVTVPRARFLGIAHNHPSGDVTPSGPDASGTGLIMKLGQMMGLDVLWSLVVTHESAEWRKIEPKGAPKPPQDGEREPYQPKDPDEDEGQDEDEGEPESDGTPTDAPDKDEDEDGEGEEDEGPDPEDEDDSEGEGEGEEDENEEPINTDYDGPDPDQEPERSEHSVSGKTNRPGEATVDDLRAAIMQTFGLKQ